VAHFNLTVNGVWCCAAGTAAVACCEAVSGNIRH
jgi:hypothetical protein